MPTYNQEFEERDNGWAFTCSAPCGFDSSGWATKKVAEDRAKQHKEEHDTNEPMQELNEFLTKHGPESVHVNARGE